MSSTGSRDSSCQDRIARATGLIRALTGVVDATVDGDAERIRSVTVVADAELSPWEITRNIQSALLASMGLPIERAIIEVRRPEGTPAASRSAPTPGPATAAAVPAAARPDHAGNGKPVTAANGARIVHNGKGNGRGNGNGKGDGNGKPQGNGTYATGLTAGNPRANGHGLATAVPAGNGSATAAAGTRSRAGGSVARLELQTRGAGRVVCRAVVAGQDCIAVGEAEAPDTPAGRLEAAARAVLAARPGADLEAIREIELNGRYYVVVALRRWSGRALDYTAEVAPVDASREAAAAHATLGAILQ